MNKQGVLTMLGFAQKARKLAAGDAAVTNFLEKKKIALLLASTEQAEDRRTFWREQAQAAGCAYIEAELTKSELGWAIGLSPRAIVGIMDQQMAEAIMKKLNA